MNVAIELGQYAEIRRGFSKEDVAAYVAIGGHDSARDELPEPLIHALFSYLLGVKLPGIGTNYLKQESQFLKTARVGEELNARVEVIRLRPEKHLVDLRTTCLGQDGMIICQGRALVYVGDVGT